MPPTNTTADCELCRKGICSAHQPNTTADRVLMRLAEVAQDIAAPYQIRDHHRTTRLKKIAAALSAHGLREAVEVVKKCASYPLPNVDTMEAQEAARWINKARKALFDMLGEGEPQSPTVKGDTLKAEEQADG